MLRILAVDDEPEAVRYVAGVLEAEHEVVVCTCGAQALRQLEQSRWDLLFVDLGMPPPDGFELLRRAQQLAPPIPVVVISAMDRARAAIEALRLGARDFIVKPATPDDIWEVVRRVAATLDPGSSGGEFHYGLAGRSPAIRKVRQLIPLLAGSRETVLILGETGTGKELVARALHGLSPTRAGPFVAHNMAATPSELAESVFFGHARGAFSGATADHLGLFEQAEGGTLFLDEVDSFPLGLQAKLLRILECARFHRVGSGTERKLDVRVIAASATELSEAVARGVFRADLYYRLRQLELRLPPLRDRREDILELVEQFVTELAHESGRRVEVSPGAMDVLRSHLWPGNCRELRNAVRGATMLAGPGPVLPGHLAAFVDSIVAPDAECATGTNLRLSEHLHILDVLERARGNQSRAARLLGIDRGTLARKLKALKLEGSTPTTRDVEGSEPARRP